MTRYGAQPAIGAAAADSLMEAAQSSLESEPVTGSVLPVGGSDVVRAWAAEGERTATCA